MVLSRVLITAAILLPAFSTAAAQTGAASGEPALPLAAAVTTSPASAILADDAAVWGAVSPQPLHLNHTPPLYDTDPRDDGHRPRASIQLLRADTTLYVRLVWEDATVDSIPMAKRYVDGGDSAIYKRQSEVIDRFRDAACVMMPRAQTAVTPSLVMGDVNHPVALYYWRNGEGFVTGTAAGRGSTALSTTVFAGHARHANDQWQVIFAVPMTQTPQPLAIALWDGSRQHRDGLKYYSLWYEVTP